MVEFDNFREFFSGKGLLTKPETTKEEFDEATKKLSEILQQVGASLYQAQQSETKKAGKDEKTEKTEKKNADKEKAEEGEVVE